MLIKWEETIKIQVSPKYDICQLKLAYTKAQMPDISWRLKT